MSDGKNPKDKAAMPAKPAGDTARLAPPSDGAPDATIPASPPRAGTGTKSMVAFPGPDAGTLADGGAQATLPLAAPAGEGATGPEARTLSDSEAAALALKTPRPNRGTETVAAASPDAGTIPEGSGQATLPVGAVTPRTPSSPTPPTRITGAAIAVPGQTAVGRRFGSYYLKKELGRGGMGAVFLAEHVKLKTEVALKVMLSADFATDRDIYRFEREAKAAAGLKHPNIVGVHDSGLEDGRAYYTMDAIVGCTLREWCKKTKPTLEKSMALMVKVCNAIGYAHERGIIHRDLKPVNVMVDDQRGEPHVMDFGLAKAIHGSVDEEAYATMSGAVVGTPHYMSPEQATGKVDEVNIKSDVYSLGVMLYEIVAGEVPFRADSLNEMIRRICQDDPTPLRRKNPAVPADLEIIIAKAMAKEPNRRYWTANALGSDLERWLENKPILARKASTFYQARKWVQRHPAFTAAGILLLAAAVATPVYLGQKKERDAREAIASVTERLTAASNALDAARRLPNPKASELHRLLESDKLADREYSALGGLDEARDMLRRVKNPPPSLSAAWKEKDEATAATRTSVSVFLLLADAGEKSQSVKIDALFDEAQRVSATSTLDEAHLLYQNANALSGKEAAQSGVGKQIDEKLARLGHAIDYAKQMKLGDEAERASRGQSGPERFRAERDAMRAFDDALKEIPEDDKAKERFIEAGLTAADIKAKEHSWDYAVDILRDVERKDKSRADLKRREVEGIRRESELAASHFADASNKAWEALINQRAPKDLTPLFAAARRLNPDDAHVQLGAKIAEARTLRAEARQREALRTLKDALRLAAEKDRSNKPIVESDEKECVADIVAGVLVEARKALGFQDLGQIQAVLADVDDAMAREREFNCAPDAELAQLRNELKSRQELPQGFVLVRAGPFAFGDETSARSVSSFAIAEKEVTNGEYLDFVRSGGYSKDALWDATARALRGRFLDRTDEPGPEGWQDGRPLPGTEELPVAGVSWYEARAYAKWKSGAFRLPTEVEWERAATCDKDGKKQDVPWKDATEPWLELFLNIDAPRRAGSGFFYLTKQGRKIQDLSPVGCADMYGNVREWCTAGSPGGAEKEEEPIVRGGSFRSRVLERSLPTSRFKPRADYRVPDVGFRLARSAQ